MLGRGSDTEGGGDSRKDLKGRVGGEGSGPGSTGEELASGGGELGSVVGEALSGGVCWLSASSAGSKEVTISKTSSPSANLTAFLVDMLRERIFPPNEVYGMKGATC